LKLELNVNRKQQMVAVEFIRSYLSYGRASAPAGGKKAAFIGLDGLFVLI